MAPFLGTSELLPSEEEPSLKEFLAILDTDWANVSLKSNPGPPPPRTNTNRFILKLPLEIQTIILFDFMEFYGAEYIIRNCYPHLAPAWVAALPGRFHRWLSDLCSRDNLEYLGTTGTFMSVDIMRFKSINLHKTLKLSVPPNREVLVATQLGCRVHDPPSLGDARLALMFHLEGLYWQTEKTIPKLKMDPQAPENYMLNYPEENWADGKAAAVEIVGRGMIEPYRLGDEELCIECLEQYDNMPLLIPLRRIPSMPYAIGERMEKERQYSYQRLLIYEDEFEIIRKNFEVAMRPVIEGYKRDDADERWLNHRPIWRIDPYDLSWWMARGIAAGSLMEERENSRPGFKDGCLHSPITDFISSTEL